MAKMDSIELHGILAAAKNDALSADRASKLSADRARAMRYYQGDISQDVPSEDGKSSAISNDVSDTVDGMMPALLEIFAGGDEVIKFEPIGPEDVQAAEQETDYVNHVFMQKNPGFLILHNMIKDALLSKAGVVKVVWEEDERQSEEQYFDLDDTQYQFLTQDPDIVVIEHTEKDLPGDQDIENADRGMPQVPVSLTGLTQKWHDVVVRRRREYAEAKVYNVPPEEFGIAASARSMQNCGYCYHETPRREADLIAEGYDEEQVRRLPTHRPWTTTEESARDTVDESNYQQISDINRGTRLVLITEHYINLDYENNGDYALYRITTGETNDILERDGEPMIVREDMVPFAAITPVIMPHRFWGKSVADLVMDIQRIKSVLVRGLLDNLYLRNNFRTEVAESFASDNTIDDLLVARPGGIVRTKQPGGLNPLQVEDISQAIYPALQYFDATREWRTGVSRQGQGIDPNSLQNQVATIANQMEAVSDKKIKLIARIFADTGIRDLFSILHATIRKHGSKAQTVRLRNQWVNIDPREWKERDDLTIKVALGSGNKAQQMAGIQQIIGSQIQALQAGLVSRNNLWHSAQALCRTLGFPDASMFFVDPMQQQQDPNSAPLPPPPDPKQAQAQQKAQADQQKMVADAAHNKMKIEAEQQIEMQKLQHQAAVDQLRFQHERELALLKHQLDVQVANHNALVKEHEAKSKAQERSQPKAQIQVQHDAPAMTGPLSEMLGHFGTHMANMMADHQARHAEMMGKHAELMAHMTAHMTAPKRVVRGKDGRVSHVETVTH